MYQRFFIKQFPCNFQTPNNSNKQNNVFTYCSQKFTYVCQWSYKSKHYQKEHQISSEIDDIKISFTKLVGLKSEVTLKEYFVFKKGMQPYEKGKGTPPQTRNMMEERIYDSKKKIDSSYKPLLRAKNIKRYSLKWEGDWIKYGKHLAAPRTPDLFEDERILLRRIISSEKLMGSYTDESYICNTDIITLKLINKTEISPHIFFFFGIILSTTCAYHLKSRNINLDRATFPKINMNTLEMFPIPQVNFSDPTEKARHARMVKLVGQILDFHKQLAQAKLPQKKTVLNRQIEATDRQIDELVYELYDLTEEEIRIVEGDV